MKNATHTTVKPFPALRPQTTLAQQIIAPPYDVVDREQARALAKDKPYHFLHISKPEIDLPDTINNHDPQIFAKGLANFQALQKQNILLSDPEPYYYLYRLTAGEHSQTGIFAALSVWAYEQGKIHQHELTQPDKVADRAEQIATLNAQTSPVLLTYRAQADIHALCVALTNSAPAYDVMAYDGVRHEMWIVDQTEFILQFDQLLNQIPAFYIADGHHRSLASLMVAQQQKNATPYSQYFLAGLFPADELKILGYHRFITDLGITRENLFTYLEKLFTITKHPTPLLPAKPGQFGLCFPDQHFQLILRENVLPKPVSRSGELDVAILYDAVLAPTLKITDPKLDQRLRYFGGKDAVSRLTTLFQQFREGAAFTLAPTAIDDMFQIADQNQIMPPKSTWFEPKLADGLVSFLVTSKT